MGILTCIGKDYISVLNQQESLLFSTVFPFECPVYVTHNVGFCFDRDSCHRLSGSILMNVLLAHIFQGL